MQTMQRNLNENGIRIFKSMINNTCLSSICYNSFWASQNHGKLVQKIMLVPVAIQSFSFELSVVPLQLERIKSWF